MHYKKLYDNRFLGAWDLDGRDSITLTISEVTTEEVKNTSGQTEKVPVVYFKEGKSRKGLVMNKTNGKAIAGQYGNDIEGWVGKKITLTVQQVSAFGAVTDALRVIPTRTRAAQKKVDDVLNVDDVNDDIPD